MNPVRAWYLELLQRLGWFLGVAFSDYQWFRRWAGRHWERWWIDSPVNCLMWLEASHGSRPPLGRSRHGCETWPDPREIRIPAGAAGRKQSESMSDQQREPILQFFAYSHLPEEMQAISKPFGELAERVHLVLPRNAERSVALRKLLEAKDAAVRAAIAKP